MSLFTSSSSFATACKTIFTKSNPKKLSDIRETSCRTKSMSKFLGPSRLSKSSKTFSTSLFPRGFFMRSESDSHTLGTLVSISFRSISWALAESAKDWLKRRTRAASSLSLHSSSKSRFDALARRDESFRNPSWYVTIQQQISHGLQTDKTWNLARLRNSTPIWSLPFSFRERYKSAAISDESRPEFPAFMHTSSKHRTRNTRSSMSALGIRVITLEGIQPNFSWMEGLRSWRSKGEQNFWYSRQRPSIDACRTAGLRSKVRSAIWRRKESGTASGFVKPSSRTVSAASFRILSSLSTIRLYMGASRCSPCTPKEKKRHGLLFVNFKQFKHKTVPGKENYPQEVLCWGLVVVEEEFQAHSPLFACVVSVPSIWRFSKLYQFCII